MKLLITTQIVDKNDPILGFFHSWIGEFAQHFERIDVICLKKGTYDLPPHVHIHSLGKEDGESKRKYLARFYYFFSTVFFGIKVDYVFFHMGAIYNILAFPFFILRKIFCTKFYWWKAHGHINWVGKLALMCVDRVYTASNESFPIESKKRFAVGHGITISEGPLSVRTINAKLQILCIGRITRVKNLVVALEVGKMLHEHAIPFTIRIIGDVVDGTYKEELEAFIKAYGLGENIIFLDPVPHDELCSLYRDIDVLLHPSKTGSIDKVVLEAMQEGVLPIALCGAYGEMLAQCNLCVTENEPVAYYNVLRTILDMSTEEYNKIRNALQRKVTNHHSLKTLPQRIFLVQSK